MPGGGIEMVPGLESLLPGTDIVDAIEGIVDSADVVMLGDAAVASGTGAIRPTAQPATSTPTAPDRTRRQSRGLAESCGKRLETRQICWKLNILPPHHHRALL